MDLFPYTFSPGAADSTGPELVVVLHKISERLKKFPKSANDKALHDIRVLIKVLRALLWLAKSTLPASAANEIKQRFRRAAGKLAGPRDAGVLRKTLKDLGEDASRRQANSLRLASQAVKDRAKDHSVSRLTWAAAIDLVQKAIREFQGRIEAVADWKSPARRVRKARKAMEECRRVARKKKGDLDYHAWRKKAKRLLYLLQILEPKPDSDTARLIKRLDKIQRRLGDYHDAAVLESRLKEKLPASDREAAQPLLKLIHQRKRRLRRKTEKVVRRLAKR
jgi:CHAD domain-containing protein